MSRTRLASSDEAPTMDSLQRQAIESRQNRLKELVVERHEHLARLYYAMQDKSRPTTFEAGLRSSATPLLENHNPAMTLERFQNDLSDPKILAKLDLSLPPMSPSPPSSPAKKSEGASLPKTNTDEKADASMVEESDADADADGEVDDDEDVKMSLTPSASKNVLPSTSNTSSAPIASTSASQLGPPSASNGTPSSAPSTALTSLSQTLSPSQVAVPASSASYNSMFGIPQISSYYPSTLPPLPSDVLRNRLVTTVRTKKGKERMPPPPDLYKMHIKAVHTGAKNFLGRGKRVHNVLSTHDWSVGLEELRALRAFERIESLKQDKAWSFRQPRKQRVGVVPKAHWDHVLDEMRWLQTDFRQEKRWKVVTAYNLAMSVRAWHRASPEERQEMCVKVGPPRLLTDEELKRIEEGGEVGIENDDDGAGEDKMNIDADGVAEKNGEVEAEADADGEIDDGEATEASKASLKASTGKENVATGASTLATTATAGTGSSSRAQAQAQAEKQRADAATAAAHIQNLIALRAPIFELGPEATVVDPAALAGVTDDSIAPSLAALFPDLPLYSDFLIALDPALDKRFEESSAWSGRINHVSKWLESKPLLVSTINPARTRTKNAWDATTSVFLDDSKEPIAEPTREQPPAALMQSALFTGGKPKSSRTDLVAELVNNRPSEPQNAEIRAASLHWAPDEDARILALVKQYGPNWSLIADVFNGSTTRPDSDVRVAWDLYDRWDKLSGPGSKKTLPDGTEISIPVPEYVPPMEVKAHRASQFANFEGSKKGLRHLTVFDAMRKVQKKRELSASKAPPPGMPRRISMAIHDSHNLPQRPLYSPMEWGAVKHEQDQQRARARAQQQAELLQQQQRLQQQQQQANGPQQGQINGGVRYLPNNSNPQNANGNFPPASQQLPPQSRPNSSQSPPVNNGVPPPNRLPNGSPAPQQFVQQQQPTNSGGGGGGGANGNQTQMTAEQIALYQARVQAQMRAQVQAQQAQQGR